MKVQEKMINDLSNELIFEKIKNNKYINKVCYLEQTGSTNDLAKEKAENENAGGVIYIVETQTSGKGRFKRKWFSKTNTGIWATALLRPDMEVRLATGYSILCAISIARAINKNTGTNAKIKWPNDVIIEGKKVCGILAEMSSKNNKIDWIAIGFGINVNISKNDFDPEILEKATSLSIEKGQYISRLTLLDSVITEFEELITKYEREKSLSFALKEYEALSAVYNKKVELIEGDLSKFGVVKGFAEDGSLLLETENGIEKIGYGEVSLRSSQIYK